MKSLRRIFSFLRPYQLKVFFAIILLLAMVAMDLVIPHLTQRIIDEGIVPRDLGAVYSTALLMVGAALSSAVFAVINNSLAINVAMNFSADIRSALIRKVQTFSFGNLDNLQTGKLIVRSTSDINAVYSVVMMSLRIFIRAPVWAIGAIVLLVLTSPRIALLMAVFVPVIVVLVLLFARKINPLFMKVQQRLDRLNIVLQENLAGMRVVKAFVRTEHEEARFNGANEALMNQTIGVAQLMAVFMPGMMLVLNLAVIGTVWMGGTFAFEGDMLVGEVVAAINYISFGLFPVLMLSGMIGPIASADASASRILEVFDAEPLIRQPKSPTKLPSSQGKIVFKNVSFSYSGDSTEPVLFGCLFYR